MTGVRRCIQRIKDPFPGLSHAVGAVLSIAGLVALLVIGPAPSHHPWLAAGLAVYGVSLILLYTASALTHTLHCSPRWSWDAAPTHRRSSSSAPSAAPASRGGSIAISCSWSNTTR